MGPDMTADIRLKQLIGRQFGRKRAYPFYPEIRCYIGPISTRCGLLPMLCGKGKLSLGKAGKLARIGRIQFQLLLASHQIPINYGIEDISKNRTLSSW
jgi:hypothetical protein